MHNTHYKLLDIFAWNYGEGGAVVSGGIAVAGVFLNSLIGGWDNMAQFLLYLMIGDTLTGFLASLKNKKTNSDNMFYGGAKKLVVFGLVVLATQLDITLGNSEPFIRTATIWFYIGRELLSMLENCGKMGVELPPILMQSLEQITKKGGTK